MISKIKSWLLGKVILKKVLGKFAKHASGVLIGLLASPQIAPWLTKLGIAIDASTLEATLVVLLTGIFGSAYNYIQHRFF